MNSSVRKTYTVVITDDVDGGHVGECDELHAYSQGETYGETVGNMREAVGLAADSMDDFNMLIVQNR